MSAPRKKAKQDVVLPVGPTEDGEGAFALRRRDDQVSAVSLRRAREGAPLTGDLVTLRPREGSPLLDVETVYEAPERAAAEPPPDPEAGPPQVASDAYRRGWSRIFGKPRTSAAN